MFVVEFECKTSNLPTGKAANREADASHLFIQQLYRDLIIQRPQILTTVEISGEYFLFSTQFSNKATFYLYVVKICEHKLYFLFAFTF